MKAFLAENSFFIKTTAVGLAILVLTFCFPVKANAAGVNFDDWVVPITGETAQGGLQVRQNITFGQYSAGPITVAFNVGDQYVLASTTQGARGRVKYSYSYGGSGWWTCNTAYDTIWYFAETPYFEPYPAAIAPTFSTLEEGLQAAQAYLTGSGGGGETEQVSTLNYSLPPGNVAFVKLPDDVTLFEGVTLRTQMPETNLLYSPNGQLWNSSQRTGFSDSLPTADYDLSQFSVINWAKDGVTTALGLTQNAIYSRGPLLIGNEYMVIVNPIYYGGTANGPYEFMLNGAVQINAVGVKGLYVYALDSSIGFTSQGGLTVPTEVIGDPFGGEIDSETGEITWTDPSGGTNAPTEGGNNLIPTGETVFDAVKKIASDFADFLKGPISAIRTVVSAITNFLTEFKSLYIWLPGPVYNLITSAIMVALTIGVVKIFV